jgi:hypothetical protein
MSKTTTQKMLDYIERQVTARTDEIAKACNVGSGVVGAHLKPHVESGALLACKVTKPGSTRETWQYKHSTAGAGKVTRDLRDMSDLFPGQPRLPSRHAAGAPAAAPAPSPAAPRVPAAAGEALPRLGQIEKGVPIPPSKRPQKGELRKLIAELDVGDSFETDYSRAACKEHADACGFVITTRPAETETNPKRIRVWREDA